jgi:predicted DsbA family dithiol-disulfide isomerase
LGRGFPCRQDELIEELFRNYFLESKTICDPEVLLAAAEKASARPSLLDV